MLLIFILARHNEMQLEVSQPKIKQDWSSLMEANWFSGGHGFQAGQGLEYQRPCGPGLVVFVKFLFSLLRITLRLNNLQ